MATALVSGDWVSKAGWDGPHKTNEVRTAVNAGADLAAIDEESGKTVLMNAAAFCFEPDCVSFLLTRGADALATDKAGRTALHHCSATNLSKNAATYASQLLKAGADPRAKDGGGSSSLELVRRPGIESPVASSCRDQAE